MKNLQEGGDNMSPLHNIFTANPPANEHEILLIEQTMAIHLPEEYKNVLKESNGFSLMNGVLIYGTEEIMERNETWEVKEYAKGYLAIGDDGGGMVFLMSLEKEACQVFVVDVGDMNPQHAILVSSHLNKWLQEGFLD